MLLTVAVFGAGRMGSVVASKLPRETRKIIVDTELEKAKALADTVGGTWTTALENAKDADLIAVVLPTPIVNDTIDKLIGIVKSGAVIINMATTAHVDPDIIKKNKDVFVVDAKIIGHAMSITKGEQGIVVVKTDNRLLFNFIKSQLVGFTDVVQGDADLVSQLNSYGTAEGIKTAVRMRKHLMKMNIPEEWMNIVIGTIGAGMIKSYLENDLGPFALDLIKKFESEDD